MKELNHLPAALLLAHFCRSIIGIEDIDILEVQAAVLVQIDLNRLAPGVYNPILPHPALAV